MLRHLEDGVDRLLLGFVDERAGVYHQNVCRLRVIGNLRARLVEQAHHDFTVDQILGAAQAHETNARPLLEHRARNASRQLFLLALASPLYSRAIIELPFAPLLPSGTLIATTSHNLRGYFEDVY